jgi:subtilisin family serine protease
MAAPHVTGVVARILQSEPAATPAAVRSTLLDRVSTNVLGAVGSGSPNRFLQMSPRS